MNLLSSCGIYFALLKGPKRLKVVFTFSVAGRSTIHMFFFFVGMISEDERLCFYEAKGVK